MVNHLSPEDFRHLFPVKNSMIRPLAHGQWSQTNKLMQFRLHIFLCGLVLQAGLLFCLAHDNPTMHPLISTNAAKSSSGLQNFLSGNYVNTSEGITNWLIAGSVFEDIPFTRGFSHFYEPTKNPAIALNDGFDWWAYPLFR